MIEIQNQILIAQSRADSRGMEALDRLQDDQRFIFLDRLHVAAQPVQVRVGDDMVTKPAKVKLTDWERYFVSDIVAEHRPLTNPQREKIDELRHRYGGRL